MQHPALRFRSGAMMVKGVPMKAMFDGAYVDLIAESIEMALRSTHAGSSRAKRAGGTTRRLPTGSGAVFDATTCCIDAKQPLETLELKPRARHIALMLRKHINLDIGGALELLVRSMAPVEDVAQTVSAATANGFYYFAHSEFIAIAAADIFGLAADGGATTPSSTNTAKKRLRDDGDEAQQPTHRRATPQRGAAATRAVAATAGSEYQNGQTELLNVALQANYALTQRFSAEFSIRPYVEYFTEPTLQALKMWVHDANPNVRRLVSEGTRPRLPWGHRLRVFDGDRSVVFALLASLRLDPSRFVTRSVANHLGDVAKDDLPAVLQLCTRWLKDAKALPPGPDGARPDGRYLSDARELKWVIRHALRHPAGAKGIKEAVTLRRAAE